MFNSGWQILRFVKLSTARQNVSWLYKFTADSLSGEHIDFVYMINDVGGLPQIITDLIHLTKQKIWVNVNLEEHNRMLMIQGIRECVETQEALNEKSKDLRTKVQ